MSEAPMPVEVRAPEGARRMEIDWDDGTRSVFRHAILRGFCPCAHCQGHHGPVRWVEGPWVASPEDRSLELSSIEQVGNYAVRLAWADGHQTGIYSFRFLFELAPRGDASIDEVRHSEFHR